MEDRTPKLTECFYLTKEQCARIAAISIDSLVGVQIRTDANDNTYAVLDYVPIDDPNTLEAATVYSDGSWVRTT